MSPDEFREARRQLGLSAAQMARALGFSDGRQIRRLEADPADASHRPVSRTVELLVTILLRVPAARTIAGLPAIRTSRRASAKRAGRPPV